MTSVKSNNKKIINASKSYYDEILFKSKLEVKCYKRLKEEGFDFKYEPDKIVIWDGIKKLDKIKSYIPSKKSKALVEYTRALLNITYTPDFVVHIGNNIAYFDVKGKANDIYPIKRKMFLNYLNKLDDGNNYIFIEPHNSLNIEQAISILKYIRDNN